jgi:hypothetical protein
VKPLTEEQKASAAKPAHLRIAWGIASYYTRRCLSRRRDEIESAALYGLCLAVATYDPKMKHTFHAHVHWRVRAAIIEALRGDQPRGYRRNSREPWPLGQPERLYGSEVASDDPVGWEVEYQDEVEGLARRAGDPVAAEAIRLRFAQASMALLKDVGRAIDRDEPGAHEVYWRGVRAIAARFEHQRYEDAILHGRAWKR